MLHGPNSGILVLCCTYLDVDITFGPGFDVTVPHELGGWEVFLTEKEKIVVLCSEQMGGWEVMTLTFNIFYIM